MQRCACLNSIYRTTNFDVCVNSNDGKMRLQRIYTFMYTEKWFKNTEELRNYKLLMIYVWTGEQLNLLFSGGFDAFHVWGTWIRVARISSREILIFRYLFTSPFPDFPWFYRKISILSKNIPESYQLQLGGTSSLGIISAKNPSFKWTNIGNWISNIH